MKHVTLLLLFTIGLFFGNAVAQNQQSPFQTPQTSQGNTGQMPNQINPIVGVWQTTIQLGQGLPEATGILYVFPNSMYREEMYINKSLGAFWEGAYTLTPDGTFTQMEGKKSPQICISQTQCVTNESESQIVSRIALKNQGEMTINLQDPTSGQMISLAYTRTQPPTGSAPVVPNMPTPNVPVVTGPTTPTIPTPAIPTPTIPTPAATSSPSTNPLAPGSTLVAANTFSQWVGSYTNGDLTVHLGSPQGNYMQRGDTQFQLMIQGDDQRLTGDFITASGNSFPIVLEQNDTTVTVATGGATYVLTQVASAAPINPLGN